MKSEDAAPAQVEEVIDRLQRELSEKEKEKVAALEMLVAGVAHELNNPLMSIMGYADLAEAEPDSASLRHDLRIIRKEASRACAIVRRLLDFAREEQIENKPLDLGQLVREALQIERSALEKAGVKVNAQLRSEGPWVIGDRLKLQQVFINLIQNARQELAVLDGQPRVLDIRAVESHGQVCVSVGDNGRGIPRENQALLFQPFFTTKEQGAGTGLGLAVSYGIIRKHRGDIRIDRNHRQGAVFEVSLPACQSSEKSGASEVPAPRPQVSGLPLRVLVVDDEESIRDFLSRALEYAGNSVALAADVESALTLLRPGAYDLIMCDWRMPGRPVRELYQKSVQCGAAGRWVFMSGDTSNPELSQFAEREGVALLLKPFGVEELLGILRESRAQYLPRRECAALAVPMGSEQ